MPHLRSAGTQAADLFAFLRQHFTHFIDLYPAAPGPHVRGTEDLAAALAYLEGSFTDLVLYR